MRFNVHFNVLSENHLTLSHMPPKVTSSNLCGRFQNLGNTDLFKLPHFPEEIA